MSMRRGLLALGGVVAVAGLGMAQPPRGPLVEGREPDPVVRQFHAAEPATFGYGAGPVTAAPTLRVVAAFEAPWLGVDFLSDLLPNQLTMPLGTVPMWD